MLIPFNEPSLFLSHMLIVGLNIHCMKMLIGDRRETRLSRGVSYLVKEDAPTCMWDMRDLCMGGKSEMRLL
jgi:hypothetical protein